MTSPIEEPAARSAPRSQPEPAADLIFLQAPDPAEVGTAWHGVDHYENFPVGSWLLPRRLRPAVFAIYRFARHADDIADEGDATAQARNVRLEALHRELELAQSGCSAHEPVVAGLTRHVLHHRLSWRYFHDLIDAFQQDLRVKRYADPEAVDDYCRRSADPVGRLMLELFDAATPDNQPASDAICSGLQRVNFLQDIVIDWEKDRIYLPLSTLATCGLEPEQLATEIGVGRFSPPARRAVAIEAERAREQLLRGRKLLVGVPSRLAWELRFILAGGLQILDRLKALDYDVAANRPALGWRDAPALLYKALTLSRQEAVLHDS